MDLVITGDIVRDSHLYGGVDASSASARDRGTLHRQRLGGAVATRDLVEMAMKAMGESWEDSKKDWEVKKRAAIEAGGQEPRWPADLPLERPGYGVHLALEEEGLEIRLPQHLHSYGVWTPHPVRRGAKGCVWRIERHFGHGASQSEPFAFERSSTAPAAPALTLIDDRAISFRHGFSRPVWPDLSTEGWFLLRMSGPLCRGELWESLREAAADRLVVVAGASDLRREAVQIDSGLSWEHCTQQTLRALHDDPIARQLLKAAHLIVTFQSAGALWVERGAEGTDSRYRLVFDPLSLEGEFEREFEGSILGSKAAFAASLAHRLMVQRLERAPSGGVAFSSDAIRKAIELGIPVGLSARRRMTELGHGATEGREPGFPFGPIGRWIASDRGGYEMVDVRPGAEDETWTILSDAERVPKVQPHEMPLRGLGILTARYGASAVSHVPALRFGKLFTVDRGEIESLRTLAALIRGYEAGKVQKKPLCLGVFGPPGAGKSFGVKALGKAILGDEAPFLEFNLSQFKSPDELLGALHRVRDAALEGTTPLAFWDEFDSQRYMWLQYLLAPMQDGSFQQGEITHPIGKSVFIFAGGTSETLQGFGVRAPRPPGDEDLAKLDPERRADRLAEYRSQEREYRDFKLLKGPDFISRLHGYLNVLGPNRQSDRDVTWPIRRALILRGLLGLAADDELEIEPGLLNALLGVDEYLFGARSLERVAKALIGGSTDAGIGRSSLLPRPLLERELDADRFHHLLHERDDFKNRADQDALAAAVHESYLQGAERAALEAKIESNPGVAWKVQPELRRAYDALDPDKKVANRAAARRIPDHLALIDFIVVPLGKDDGDSWKKSLEEAIEKHIERLAQAEHLGWCAERIANGWTCAQERDDERKHHPLLVPWTQLARPDRDKDRTAVRAIPELLRVAGFKAVPPQSG